MGGETEKWTAEAMGIMGVDVWMNGWREGWRNRQVNGCVDG